MLAYSNIPDLRCPSSLVCCASERQMFLMVPQFCIRNKIGVSDPYDELVKGGCERSQPREELFRTTKIKATHKELFVFYVTQFLLKRWITKKIHPFF